MNRTPRDFNARQQLERQWLIENTWCDQCNAADQGIEKPSEYEENGHIFIEGVCRVCGKKIRSEIAESDKLDSVQIDRQLVAEIKNQLNDDILNFAWMVQIARSQNTDCTKTDCVNAVFDSVIELHGDGEIVVGNARNENDMVLIEPWPETGQELRTRMVSAIETSDGDDRAFCFWIQLTEHFAR